MRHLLIVLLAGFAVALMIPSVSPAGTDAPDTGSAIETAMEPLNPVEERVLGIQRLGRSGDENAAGPLIDLLLNPLEPDAIRTNSARALTRLGSPRADILSAFHRVLESHSTHGTLRYTILFCLGEMRAVESLSLLAEALSDTDPMGRFKAVQALGSLETPEALSLLVSHIPEEDDPIVRAEAIRALGSMNLSQALSPLAQALRSDPNALVRWNAALALTHRKRPVPLPPEVRSALAAARTDPSPMVRKTVEGTKP